MPSGKTHDIITILLTPIVIIGSYYFNNNVYSTIIITISYIFAGLMFNGDLDVPSKPFYRWKVLRLIWIPYQDMFSHRSFWTHGYIIGTIIRLIYLSPIICGICYLFEFNPFNDKHLFNTLYVLIGLELGSFSHSFIDDIL